MDKPDASHPVVERRSRYPLIIAAIVLAGAVLIVSTGFSGGRYSLEIASVTQDREAYVGHEVKVVGKIKEGSSSIEDHTGVVELHFTVHDGEGHEIKVIYPHNPPDPFKEGRECIVEGLMQADNTILCSKLTVKCPSKYQNEDDAAGGGASMDDYKRKYGGAAPSAPEAGGR